MHFCSEVLSSALLTVKKCTPKSIVDFFTHQAVTLSMRTIHTHDGQGTATMLQIFDETASKRQTKAYTASA